MRNQRGAWSIPRWKPLLAALLVGAAGCEEPYDELTGPGRRGGEAPRQVQARFDWVFQGWESGQPRGYPAVRLTWALPSRWNGEAFRVYARRAGQADYSRIATVTSCTPAGCAYTDTNVRSGSTYEYFITAVDEELDWESEGSALARVSVPASSTPTAPAVARAVGLDGAVYLQWSPTGAERYWVLIESADGRDILDVGQTDGRGFLDTRAVNGTRYRYRLAAVDTLGRVSALGPVSVAIPRPDHRAELLYAFADSAAASGFQFVASDSVKPIVAGTSGSAHLRLQVVNGALSLVPLGATTITSGALTTALTCGPGSDPDCVAVESATGRNAPTDFASRPVAVVPELTYLLRVRGTDGRTRYGKIRISLEGSDQRGRDLVVFDWAYQLIPDEPSLNRR